MYLAVMTASAFDAQEAHAFDRSLVGATMGNVSLEKSVRATDEHLS